MNGRGGLGRHQAGEIIDVSLQKISYQHRHCEYIRSMTFLEMSKPGGPSAWQHWQLTITILKKYFKKIPCSIFITFPYSWGCLRFNHSSKKLRLYRQFIKIQLLQICFSLMQTVKIPPKLQTMSSGTSLLSM